MATNKIRKSPLLIIPVILLAGLCVWFVSRRPSSPPIRHLVLISIDTCRADYLSCYGYPQPTTPNIDSLASEGYLFSNVITPLPLTLPAHTSMFTGTIPPQHGKHDNKNFSDPPSVTLAELLKKKGYQTGAFVGAQILNNRHGLSRGFDTYNDQFAKKNQSERRAGEVNRVAFEWLEKQKDKQIFLFLHYYDPHDDYNPPEPFATKFKESPYAGEVAYADHCIGEVVAKLKSLGMYESSLIIVTGDHGEMLGEHGEITHRYFIYQSAIKVPMIYKLPGSNIPHKIDDIAGIIDIVPTLCSLLDIEPPAQITGKNLAGYFNNKPPEEEDRYLYCESLYPTNYNANSLLGLTGNRWKYIQTTRPELYDIQQDPGELTNLVEKEPHRARILKDRLAQVLEQTVRKDKEEDKPLDAESIKHLESLGYVTGSRVKVDFSFDQSKTDPKDMIGFHTTFQSNALGMSKNNAEAGTLGESLLKQWAQSHKLSESGDGNGDKANTLKSGRPKGPLSIPGFVNTLKQEQEAKQLEETLELMSKDKTVSPAKLAEVNNELGKLRLEQRKRRLAIVQFKKKIKLDKQPGKMNIIARILLNNTNQISNATSEALEFAMQACEQTQSKHPVYLSTLAAAYAAVGNSSEAVKTAEKALAMAKTIGDEALITRLQKELDLYRSLPE
ncbi:MAG: sulfatase-like hydrolase/transferase [Planctomycetes bacterium]|nr:sulfatase-like hydrolase/transferase [Planctomycetota bacterium]